MHQSLIISVLLIPWINTNFCNTSFVVHMDTNNTYVNLDIQLTLSRLLSTDSSPTA